MSSYPTVNHTHQSEYNITFIFTRFKGSSMMSGMLSGLAGFSAEKKLYTKLMRVVKSTDDC